MLTTFTISLVLAVGPLVDAQTKPLIEHEKAVAMSVAVRRGNDRYIAGYGRLSMEDATKPDGDTVYEIGSVTKVLTVVLAADLVARGQVKWDDPISDLLPKHFSVPQFEDRQISLRDLATHRSALPRMPINFKPGDPRNPYADFTAKHLVDGLAETKLKREPGQKYEYSNLGMGLLGFATAYHARQTYEQLVIEKIARPLEMKDTTITLRDDQRKRLTRGYDATRHPVLNWDLDALAGAGAVRSTARDMLRFVEANIDGGERPVHKVLKMIHERQAKTDTPPGSIALGWHIALDGSTYWHNGQTAGYHCIIAFNRPLTIGVVVFATGDTTKIDELGMKLVQTLAGVPVKPVTFEKPAQIDPAILDGYVGRYELVPTFILTVRRKGDGLFVQATGQPEIQVYPRSNTEFFYTVVDAQITFVVDDAGKAISLTLHQNGRDMEAKRIE